LTSADSKYNINTTLRVILISVPCRTKIQLANELEKVRAEIERAKDSNAIDGDVAIEASTIYCRLQRRLEERRPKQPLSWST